MEIFCYDDITHKFSSIDIEKAKSVLKLLLPFKKLCATLSNNSCTVKFALPLLVEYQRQTTAGFSTRNINESFETSRAFNSKMEKYYTQYKENDIHLLSSYLNINFAKDYFLVTIRYRRKKVACSLDLVTGLLVSTLNYY